MTEKTMVEVFDRLKPHQLDLIVRLIKEKRPGFHRGLLPFLDKKEALRALKTKLEYNLSGFRVAATSPALGIKYIRQTIAAIGDEPNYPDMETVTLALSDERLRKYFRQRYRKEFNTITLGGRLTTLKWLSKDLWEIKCQADHLERVSTYLLDCFRA